MINTNQKNSVARKLLLWVIVLSGSLMIGCSGCKPSGSPSSVTISAQNGQCIYNANITCSCSGGGILSTCSDANQTFKQGDIVSGLTEPCPSTFDCSQMSNCSS